MALGASCARWLIDESGAKELSDRHILHNNNKLNSLHHLAFGKNFVDVVYRLDLDERHHPISWDRYSTAIA